MDSKSTFNATICLLGVLVLLLHTFVLLIKKGRRKDENALLVFFIFTIVHFATYFTFVMIKQVYTSNPFIIAFYTIFYIFNNIKHRITTMSKGKIEFNSEINKGTKVVVTFFK